MNIPELQRLALEVTQGRTTEQVLTTVVAGLNAQADVALARIWLIRDGDICHRCPMAKECPGEVPCLHLVAGQGTSLEDADCSRLDGFHSRMPLRARKVGQIAQTQTAVVVNDAATDPHIADKDWVKRERIVSFGGQPLLFRGQVLGVLGVFSRVLLDEDAMAWMRVFADHCSGALITATAFEEAQQLRLQLQRERDYLQEEVRVTRQRGGIVGSSPALERTLHQVEMVADTPATVLIVGESGVGKELIAGAIHEGSGRAPRTMVRVNCASIPNELFESEFFGHVRGAFTGAVRDRIGRFALADGGTLFLDEVGEIPLPLQGKLLRVLQEGSFERVGESQTHKVDVRVIAATNRDLKAEAEAGRFRLDLYYRLSVFPIAVPPLRDRRGDVPQLASVFLKRAEQRLGSRLLHLTQMDMEQLVAYDWPGNVRELQNAIERAAILAGPKGRARVELGTPAGREVATRSQPAEGRVLTEAEIDALIRRNTAAALAACDGRIYGDSGAASMLGLKPSTLRSRIKKLGL